MRDEIVKFLRGLHLGNRSDTYVRKLVADHFDGKVVGRYVKIGDEEFFIIRDASQHECGFEVRKMDWTHGNDWRFYTPY